MSKQSKQQKDTVRRVMHEFKEGDLRTQGKGPKVKNRKQAIAIALHEAGASNQETAGKNRENLRKTKAKERSGAKDVAGTSTSPRARLGKQASKHSRAQTKSSLYAEAKRRNVPGRSRMSKAELERAIGR